jgi:two-component sensor histidine kinase
VLPDRPASRNLSTRSSPKRFTQAASARRPMAEDGCWRELEEARARLAAAEDRAARRDLEVVELNHRVASSLQLAASFLIFQGRKLADDQAKEALAAAGARIAAIANFHRRMARHDGAGSLDLGDFLKDLASEIGEGGGLRCLIDAEPVEVPADAALNIALVINELAINASKHAYDGAEGAFLIDCRRDGSGHLIITVADDGPGLPDGFDLQEGGLGMSIASAIAHQLDADLRAKNVPGAGACFILRVPTNGSGSAGH